MAQLTSFRSIPAAAEGLVTFRFRFSWWKARLLVCLGSSAAQGDAGGPGAPPLRRKTAPKRWFGQARRSCGIALALNFCKPRAQWPGRNRRKPLRFCAPEMLCPAQGVTPVNGGPGGGRHGGRGGNAVPADCAHPLAALWFLSARAERNSPPGRRNSPCK